MDARDPNPQLVDGAPLAVTEARVLLRGEAVRRRGTASMVRLDSGRILLAFTIRRPQPVGMMGALMLTRSEDGGRTWEEPFPMLALPGWNAFPMGLFRIRDNLLRMSIGRTLVDQTLGGDEPFAGWWGGEIESRDGGESWSVPGPEVHLFPYWTEMYGPGNPHRLADGRLLWIATGTSGRDEGWMVGVTATDANGSGYEPITIIAAAPDRRFADPDMGRLADGQLVAVLREMATRQSHVTRSADDGRTWTEPVPAGFRGSNHRVSPLRDGSLLCAYRDEDPAQYGVSLSVTRDGMTWDWIGQVYRGGANARHEPLMFCGYPALVRVSERELLCVLHTYVTEAGLGELHLLRLRDLT